HAGLGDRPAHEAAHPQQHVPRPRDLLPELAVARNVDAGLGLQPYHLGHRAPEAVLVLAVADGLVALLALHQVDERLRPREAADVRREDAPRVARHRQPFSISTAAVWSWMM